MQINISVKFHSIPNANHFFKGKEKELAISIKEYIKDIITVIQFLIITPPVQGSEHPVVVGKEMGILR